MTEPNTKEQASAGGESHWADRAASQIAATGSGPFVVCTGISPSGPFHVGHLREILTGDAVTRALRDQGQDARLVFIVDNLDPLRKVYPFLDPEIFADKVGFPLVALPGPDGQGRYDQHFLAPFLDALETLGVDADIRPASEFYGSGQMNDVVFTALEKRDTIARILEEVTGKTVPPEWSPWNPRDPDSGRICAARVLDFDRREGWIRFRVTESGAEHVRRVTEGGKLTWRVDWPARWKALGVSVEPFGKDHASRGGSYDSGKRLAREVFDMEPPFPIVYEWIALKGQGDMSASRGNVLEPSRLLEAVPPEVLRYVVLKARPTRAIRFDPGLPLLRVADEVDRGAEGGPPNRALELSTAADVERLGVPWRHLVLVGQIADFDPDRAREILERGGYRDLEPSALARRLEMVRRWLESFAPEEVKVSVCATLPASVAELSESQKRLLGRLAEALESLDDPEAIQATIRELGGAEDGPGVGEGFKAVYRALIDRDRGPRAGHFIAALGPRQVARRLAEAAGS
ncbi:MAG: lysine--tRNA ligase [Acidobacteriota bacterium]|nr:lysine--tRNA ligase [Acidobacteriota bacterium]